MRRILRGPRPYRSTSDQLGGPSPHTNTAGIRFRTSEKAYLGPHSARLLMLAVLAALVVAGGIPAGCGMSVRSAAVGSSPATLSEETLVSPNDRPQESLIKPTLQDEPPGEEAVEQETASPTQPDSSWNAEAASGPGARLPNRESDTPPASDDVTRDRHPRQWEDQRVEAAAKELAAKTSGVIKCKICYDVNQDEWWAVLFEDHGSIVDIKPFIWNRDSASFEPFLVVRQIAKDRLEVHVSEDEPSRPCRVVDLPSR
ncbi:MAG: hypothetical protein AB1646_16025 [Thermodesulfobacteriota bacterium]